MGKLIGWLAWSVVLAAGCARTVAPAVTVVPGVGVEEASSGARRAVLEGGFRLGGEAGGPAFESEWAAEGHRSRRARVDVAELEEEAGVRIAASVEERRPTLGGTTEPWIDGRASEDLLDAIVAALGRSAPSSVVNVATGNAAVQVGGAPATVSVVTDPAPGPIGVHPDAQAAEEAPPAPPGVPVPSPAVEAAPPPVPPVVEAAPPPVPAAVEAVPPPVPPGAGGGAP